MVGLLDEILEIKTYVSHGDRKPVYLCMEKSRERTIAKELVLRPVPYYDKSSLPAVFATQVLGGRSGFESLPPVTLNSIESRQNALRNELRCQPAVGSIVQFNNPQGGFGCVHQR